MANEEKQQRIKEIEARQAEIRQERIKEIEARQAEIRQADIDQGTAARRGFFEGASLGAIPTLAGGLEAVGRKVVGKTGFGGESMSDIRDTTPEEEAKGWGEIYDEARDKRRLQQDDASAAHPKTYMAGDVAGSLLIPGSGVKTVVGQGAASAFNRSRADNPVDLYVDTVAGAGLARLGHGIMSKAGKVADDLVKPDYAAKAAKVQKEADEVGIKALNFSPGNIKDGKFLPGTDQTSGAGTILHEGLHDLPSVLGHKGSTTNADKLKRVRNLEAKNKAELDAEYENSGNKTIKYGELEDRILQVAADSSNEGFKPAADLGNQLMKVLEQQSKGGLKRSTDVDVQWIRRWASKLFKDQPENVEQLADKEIWGALKDTLPTLVANPDKLRKLNADQNILINLKKGLENQTARDMGGGKRLTQSLDTGAAVLGTGSAAGAAVGGEVAAGSALGGLTLLGLKGRSLWNQYGQELKSIGLHKKSKALSKKEWQQPLLKAAQRGTKALQATHFLLMQRDPKYRESVNSDKKEQE